VSAYGVVIRGPGEGRDFTVGVDRVVVKGSTAHEGDGFSVVEYEGAARAPGPPLHLHRAFEECWYILEGEVDFSLGEEVRRVGPGGFVLVPRDAPHTFRVAGDAPARWLGIFSPANGLGLIEELGELLPADGPPDVDKVMALFARYQTEVLGGPIV
jgi:mannose-6-phosphate isomerase-like protein (cupin superfamily)